MSKSSFMDLTQGSVIKNLIKFCIPFLLSSFLQAFLNVTDMFIISNFAGENSISGVGIGGQFTFLIINAVIGLSVGANVIIGQYYGAKKMDDIQKTVSSMFTLYLIIAVVVGAIVIICVDFFLKLLNTPAESFQEAKNYIIVSMFGIIFIFAYNGIAAMLRGMGDSKRPLYFILSAVIINIALDLIMVKMLKWGASGAALSTVIAQFVSVIYGFNYLKNKGIFEKGCFKLRLDKEKVGKILKVGIPCSLQHSVSTLSFLTITSLINKVGGADAVYTSGSSAIAQKYNGFALMPARAMSSGISNMVAQNVGANLYDRVKKTFLTGLIISFSIGLIFLIITLVFSKGIISIFNTSPKIVEYGVAYLSGMCYEYIMLPIVASMYGMVDGFGKTKITMVVNIFASVFLRIPVAYFLALVCKLGMFGIGLSIPITSIIASLIIYTYVLFNKKQFNRNII